jgi:hypothetical protein
MKKNLIMGLLLAFLVGCVDGSPSEFNDGGSTAIGGGSTTSAGYIQTPNGDTLVGTGLIQKSTFDKDKMTINNSSYMKIRGR